MSTYSSKDPKLILAVPATLSHGPSRAVFAEFAEISDNVVLLRTQLDLVSRRREAQQNPLPLWCSKRERRLQKKGQGARLGDAVPVENERTVHGGQKENTRRTELPLSVCVKSLPVIAVNTRQSDFDPDLYTSRRIRPL